VSFSLVLLLAVACFWGGYQKGRRVEQGWWHERFKMAGGTLTLNPTKDREEMDE